MKVLGFVGRTLAENTWGQWGYESHKRHIQQRIAKIASVDAWDSGDLVAGDLAGPVVGGANERLLLFSFFFLSLSAWGQFPESPGQIETRRICRIHVRVDSYVTRQWKLKFGLRQRLMHHRPMEFGGTATGRDIIHADNLNMLRCELWGFGRTTYAKEFICEVQAPTAGHEGV